MASLLPLTQMSGQRQKNKRMGSKIEGNGAFRSNELSDQDNVDDTIEYDDIPADSQRCNTPFGSTLDVEDICGSAPTFAGTTTAPAEGLPTNPFYGCNPPHHYNPYFHPFTPFPPCYAPVYPWLYPPPPIVPCVTAPYPPPSRHEQQQCYPSHPYPYPPSPHPQSGTRYTPILAYAHPFDRSEGPSGKETSHYPHQSPKKSCDVSESRSNCSSESKPHLAFHQVLNPGPRSMPTVEHRLPQSVAFHPDQQLPQQPVRTFESFASSETDQREDKNMRSRSRAARLKEQIQVIKSKHPRMRTREEVTQLNTFEERRLRKNRNLRDKAQEMKRRFEQIKTKSTAIEDITHEEKLFMADVRLKKRKKSDADKSRRSRQKDSDGNSVASSILSSNTNHADVWVPSIHKYQQHTIHPYLHSAFVPPLNAKPLQPPQILQDDPLPYYEESSPLSASTVPAAPATAASVCTKEHDVGTPLREPTAPSDRPEYVTGFIDEPMSLGLNISPSIFDRSPPTSGKKTKK